MNGWMNKWMNEWMNEWMNVLTTNDIKNYDLKVSNAINNLILFYMLFVCHWCVTCI